MQNIKAEIEKLSPWVGGIVNALTERIIKMNIKLLQQERMKSPE